MSLPGVYTNVLGGKIPINNPSDLTEAVLYIGPALDGPLNEAIKINSLDEFERIFGPAVFSSDYLDPLTTTATNRFIGPCLHTAVHQAIQNGARNIKVARATGAYALNATAFTSLLNLRSKFPGAIYNQAALSIVNDVAGTAATVTIHQPFTKGGNYSLTFAVGATVEDLITDLNNEPKNKCIYADPQSFIATQSTLLNTLQGAVTTQTGAAGATKTLTAATDSSVTPVIVSATAGGPVLTGLTHTLAYNGTNWVVTFVGATAATVTTVNYNLPVKMSLSSGTNGLRVRGDSYGPENVTGVNGFFSALTAAGSGTFDSLYDAQTIFQVACLVGLYIDDQIVDGAGATNATVADAFVNFLDKTCADITPCFGVLACRPPLASDVTKLNAWIDGSLLATSYGAYNSALRWNKVGPMLYDGFVRTDEYSEDGTFDLGSRFSVVAGPECVFVHPQAGRYTEMPHAAIAAKMVVTAPERSVQNQPIGGVLAYGIPFPLTKMKVLSLGVGATTQLSGRGRYIFLDKDTSNPVAGFKIKDDPSAARTDNIFRDHNTMHLANAIQNTLQVALAGYIGQSRSPGQLAAMENTVRNVLQGYAQSGGLRGGEGQGYWFKLDEDGTDAALNLVRLNITIRPSNVIDTIVINFGVKPTN